jgi:hypothetical protein
LNCYKRHCEQILATLTLFQTSLRALAGSTPLVPNVIARAVPKAICLRLTANLKQIASPSARKDVWTNSVYDPLDKCAKGYEGFGKSKVPCTVHNPTIALFNLQAKQCNGFAQNEKMLLWQIGTLFNCQII